MSIMSIIMSINHGTCLLIGSGPTATKFMNKHFWYNEQIAVVNGAIDIVPIVPTIYGVFENTALQMYIDKVKTFLGYARSDRCKDAWIKYDQFPTWHHHHIYGVVPPIHIVGEHFGPEDLRILNRDSEGAQVRETWISSGVMMLWILADYYKFKEVVVYGLDGYRTVNDYAPKIVPTIESAKHHLPEVLINYDNTSKTNEWMERMNKHMSEGIRLITNHYTSTKFVWYKKPHHYSDRWKVDFLT